MLLPGSWQTAGAQPCTLEEAPEAGERRGKVLEPEVQQQDPHLTGLEDQQDGAFSCREGVGTVVTFSDRSSGSLWTKEREDLATTWGRDFAGREQSKDEGGQVLGVSGPAGLAHET